MRRKSIFIFVLNIAQTCEKIIELFYPTKKSMEEQRNEALESDLCQDI